MITGTMISADGVVLTCAHLPVPVGGAVTIGLADGRRVPARVIAVLPKAGESRSGKDIALLEVTERGPFPCAVLAAASPRELGATFVAIGFPDTQLFGHDRASDPLYVRLGSQIQNPHASCEDEICTTIRGTGGDSGGPLFNLAGQIVGVVHGGDLSGAHTTYTRIDVLRRSWSELVPGRRVPPAPGAMILRPQPVGELPRPANRVRASIVEVRSRSQLVALGVVVGDGLILTKASELGPELTVVTPDDYVAIAETATTDPNQDLALLRLPYAPEVTRGMPPIDWSDASPPPGTLVWSVGSASVAHQLGITCGEPRNVPRIDGFIPCEFEQGQGGVRVVRVVEELRRFRLRRLPMPLRVGDTLISVEGVPVATIEDYKAVMFSGNRLGSHPPVAGEPISIQFRRDGETIDETISLEFSQTPTGQLVRPASARYSDFPLAIATDLPAYPEHCGAVVVDSAGSVVGMLIGRAPFVESLVIPARQVAGSVHTMMQRLQSQP